MGVILNKVFFEYEHLAKYYASKIWNESNLGVEREDIEQDLKLKLLLAIKSYSKRWKEYRLTNRNKPVPMEFYLKTVMLNKSRDLIKEINSAKFIRQSEMTYDRGIETAELEIKKTDIKIGGCSILDFFEGEEKRILKIFIMTNFDEEKTAKIYKGKRMGERILKDVLRKLKVQLKSEKTQTREFEVFYREE